MSPQGKQPTTLVSLVSVVSLLTQPLTECFYLKHVTQFPVSKLYGVLWRESAPFLLRRVRGFLLYVAYGLSPARRVFTGLCRSLGLWQHQAESWQVDSLISADVPTLIRGTSTALRHPHSLCGPWDPETTLSHLGFCPALPPEHL